MKKKLVKIMSVVMSLGLMFSLTACGTNSGDQTAGKSGDKKKVGIIQIVDHPSLNTIRESIIAELEAKGFKNGENIVIDYKNAQDDQSNLKAIAQKFVADKYDLIIAIATPSAQAVISETSSIPIVFSAVTDPAGSLQIADLEHPGGNVTGTSDLVLADQIMGLGMEITPNIKTIGALYTSSETNSVFVINNLKEFAAKNNLKVEEATVTATSEIQQAVNSLVSKVDAIFIPIDNKVASAMPTVAAAAIKAKIPVYVGADSMVKDGGLATYGVNYASLGKETGDMAAQILNGSKAGDIPVKTIKDYEIFVNQATADSIGVKLSEQILQKAAEVFK